MHVPLRTYVVCLILVLQGESVEEGNERPTIQDPDITAIEETQWLIEPGLQFSSVRRYAYVL